MARTKAARSTRSLVAAKKQLIIDMGERCGDIAKRRGVNLFEMLLEFALGNEQALGYEGKRTRFMKDGTVLLDDWITPEMRFAAVKEALKYVAPQLSAIAITDITPPSEDEEAAAGLAPATRAQIIEAIKRDPFFHVKPEEIVDVTPQSNETSDEDEGHNDPFKG